MGRQLATTFCYQLVLCLAGVNTYPSTTQLFLFICKVFNRGLPFPPKLERLRFYSRTYLGPGVHDHFEILFKDQGLEGEWGLSRQVSIEAAKLEERFVRFC
jgi:hypothetical protein